MAVGDVVGLASSLKEHFRGLCESAPRRRPPVRLRPPISVAGAANLHYISMKLHHAHLSHENKTMVGAWQFVSIASILSIYRQIRNDAGQAHEPVNTNFTRWRLFPDASHRLKRHARKIDIHPQRLCRLSPSLRLNALLNRTMNHPCLCPTVSCPVLPPFPYK